jgi:hypothetical protein
VELREVATEPGRPPLAAGARLRRGLAALVFFVAATVVMTWPVARHPGDHLVVPRDFIGRGLLPTSPDTYLHLYILAWVAHVLPGAPAALFDAPMMVPAARALAGSEHMLAHWPVHAPVYAATGNPVLAYQWVLFSAFVLNGMALFALARRWTGSTPAALLGGTIYAFLPLRFELIGTVQHLNVAYLPLAVLAAERFRVAGRRGDLVAFGGLVALQALTSYYLAYATVVALPVVCGVAWLAGPRATRGRGVALALAAGAGLVPLALVSWPYLALRAAAVVPEYPERWLRAASATPGWFVHRGEPLFAGFVPLALAAVGLVAGGAARRRLLLAAGMAVVGAILVLGPTLDLAGHALPLPYRALYAWVPGFSSLRYPYRFGVLWGLGLALFASLGWARVVRAHAWAWPATALALVIVCLEYRQAPLAAVPVETGSALPPAYGWLREHGGGRPLLEWPVAAAGDLRAGYQQSRAMYFGTYHRLPLLNGYTAYEPPSHGLVFSLAARLPDARAVADLVDLTGVQLLLLHRDQLDADARARFAAWLAAGGCAPLAEFDADVVCGLPAAGTDLRARLRAANERAPTETFRGLSLEPLPEGARHGRLVPPGPLHAFPTGLVVRLRVEVANQGDAPWPGLAPLVPGVVAVRHRWTRDGAWQATPLLCDLAPGESCAVVVPITPPAPGSYDLELDVAQEGGATLVDGPVVVPVRTVPLLRPPLPR